MGTVVIKDPLAIKGSRKTKGRTRPHLEPSTQGGWEVWREERGDLPGRNKDSTVRDATLSEISKIVVAQVREKRGTQRKLKRRAEANTWGF